MDKFQKLSQLSKEIQILETAGKIKAAEVLHKKFIKESQYMMPQMMPQMMPMMMMPQMMPQMMMARPTATVAPAAVARPVVNQTPAAAPKPVVAPTPVQQGQQSQTGQTGQVTPPAQSTTPPATQPPVVNPPVTTPPPMPIDKIKRQYGDGQSKNEELQYLDKEKRRLEELGYNDPKSPFYQQYLTIIGMINRNKGGSIIKKSENMNKLQKLAQLNQDIELLETAGKFKAAEILQKKFVKEAQLKSARDLMTEFNLLSTNPRENQRFEQLLSWYNYNKFSYSDEDQNLIEKGLETAKNNRDKYNFSTSINADNPTLPNVTPTPASTPAPTSTPSPTPVATPTSGNAQDTNRNYQQEAVDAQKMRDRVKYYNDKINAYNTEKDPRKKSTMKVWLLKYIKDNYSKKLIDDISYNNFMIALGDKTYLAETDNLTTPSVIQGF